MLEKLRYADYAAGEGENVRKEVKEALLGAHIEVVPSPKIGFLFERYSQDFSDVAAISVTSSPQQSPEATIDTASDLLQIGFRVIPHIAAHQIKDRGHLEEVTSSIGELGIDNIVVIKGDGARKGQYETSAQIIADISKNGAHFSSIGIAGHPEGLPGISEEQIQKALLLRSKKIEGMGAKVNIITQLCFDIDAVASYIENLRTFGVTASVKVGVPVSQKSCDLYQTAKRCGVGESSEKLLGRKYGYGEKYFLPEEFVSEFLEKYDPRTLGISGFYVCTLNQITKIAEWRRKLANA